MKSPSQNRGKPKTAEAELFFFSLLCIMLMGYDGGASQSAKDSQENVWSDLR